MYLSLPADFSVFADEDETLKRKYYSVIPENYISSAGAVGHTSAYSSGQYTAKLKIFGFFPIKTVTLDVITRQEVSIGGQSFGIKLYTDGVIVVGCGNFIYHGSSINPAHDAGIRVGDRLMSANGQNLKSNEQLSSLIKANTSPITFTVIRKNLKFTTTVTPIIPDGDSEYHIGLWVRDSSAGIGTVTYYNHDTHRFGGLGHSVADIDTGEIMPSSEGSVVKSDITDIVKGSSGQAGQLSGVFSKEIYGKLIANTDQGIFAKSETDVLEKGKKVPIALKNEIKVGKAQICTTLDAGGPKYYDVEIEKIYNNLRETKNMVIRITDKKLLQKTGGIVQGMSGSPILQNGKLVGAVTHVYLDDPTKGYGIFIEKMLLAENEIAH